jgi:hypothetical protein
MSKPLQVISDGRGTVVMGFLAAGVYYLRFLDEIVSGLGIRCASQIRKDLADTTAVACFFDVASTEGGDFAARSAVVRALLSNRRRLTSVATLVATGPVVAKARALVSIPGCAAHVVTSADTFLAQMLEVAPLAQTKLPPARSVPAARSVRPAARSVRPRTRSVTHA